MKMHPTELAEFQRQGEILRQRKEARAAEQARTAALAGPKADELRAFQAKAASLREQQRAVLGDSLEEGRTLFTDEAQRFDELQAEIEEAEAKAASLIRAHRPA